MPAIRTASSIHASVAMAAAIGLTIAWLALSAGPSAGAGHTVQISEFAFAPPVLTVSVGDTVTWTNLDPVVHTATSTAGAFDSGDLAQGQSYSHTFSTPGTYGYLCTPHPTMTGTVVVAAAATAAPTAAPTATAATGGGLPNVAMPSASSHHGLAFGIALGAMGLLLAIARLAGRPGESGRETRGKR